MSAMTKARWQRIALQQNLVSFRVDRFLRNPSRFLQRAGGPFYLVPDQAVVVRNRSGVESNTLRKPEILPPEEVRVAIAEVVEENYGAERDQLVQAVARLFGFGSTSAQLREVVETALTDLLDAGRLRLEGRLVTRGQPEATSV